MILFTALITLSLAITISIVAAYISVSGMMALFSGEAIIVCGMMLALEAGKLNAAHWLHSNWKNKTVGVLHKAYLLIAVLVLMLITSIGIYGFLSKGHLDEKAPNAAVAIQIAQKEQIISRLKAENERLLKQSDQIDAGFAAMLSSNDARRAVASRSRQKEERLAIQKQIKANDLAIQKVEEELLPLQVKTSDVEAKLGPIKYVAELFGWSNPDTAVRMIIVMLMFAFDPLAVVLLISATISFEQWSTQKKLAAQVSPTIDTPVDTKDDGEVVEEVAPTVSDSVEETVGVDTDSETVTVDDPVVDDSTPEPESQPDEDTVDDHHEELPPPEVEAALNEEYEKNWESYHAVETDSDETRSLYREQIRQYINAGTGGDINPQEELIDLLEEHPDLLERVIEIIREDEPKVEPQITEEPVKPVYDDVKPLPHRTSWLNTPQKKNQ